MSGRASSATMSIEPHSADADADAATASSSRSAKRQKVTRACDNCKSRKRRCTGELPCTACFANGSRCTYLASYTRGRLVQPARSAHASSGKAYGRELSETDKSPNDSNGTAAVAAAAATSSSSQADGSAHGAGTESPPLDEDANYGGQYLGPTSPYTFLRRAWKRFEEDGSQSSPTTGPADEQGSQSTVFAFGDRHADAVRTDDFRLPKRAVTAHLFAQYFDFAVPTYRFVHKPSVAQWLATYHQLEELDPGRVALLPARRAIVLLVMAMSRLLDHEEGHTSLEPDEEAWRDAEQLYCVAMAILDTERGKARLESVQARLMGALYLQQTSRPNQAWYQFGTTAQLMMALGLHRACVGMVTQHDHIVKQCRRRTFWAASTLDTYLSVVLGRPPLIHLEDVDQAMPEAIDDEDLNAAGVVTARHTKDSIIQASILHAQLMRIVKKAAREQYSVQRRPAHQQLETAAKLNAETAAWHASLPVVLSGAIHPSSLIPILRRQTNVLQLAHTHAVMLINRPCLLLDPTQPISTVQPALELCLTAAKTALDTIITAAHGKQIFPSFWLTKYTAFVALSVIYVWLIQRKHGRLRDVEAPFTDDELLSLAESAHALLAEISQVNAPSVRFNFVLEELRQEIHRLNPYAPDAADKQQHILLQQQQQQQQQVQRQQQDQDQFQSPDSRPPHMAGLVEGQGRESVGDMKERSPAVNGSNGTGEAGDVLAADPSAYTFTDLFTNDFPIDPDLWLQLDSFPFSDFAQMA